MRAKVLETLPFKLPRQIPGRGPLPVPVLSSQTQLCMLECCVDQYYLHVQARKPRAGGCASVAEALKGHSTDKQHQQNFGIGSCPCPGNELAVSKADHVNSLSIVEAKLCGSDWQNAHSVAAVCRLHLQAALICRYASSCVLLPDIRVPHAAPS